MKCPDFLFREEDNYEFSSGAETLMEDSYYVTSACAPDLPTNDISGANPWEPRVWAGVPAAPLPMSESPGT